MNWPVLKDLKTVIGFAASILLGVTAIILAVNSKDYWVPFVVVSLILMFLSAFRADKIGKSNS
ncbi:hypothetical protein [Virgibacillus ainsalahensis]